MADTITLITCACGAKLGTLTTPAPRPDTTNTITFVAAPIQPAPIVPRVICKSCHEAMLSKGP